MWPRLLLLGLTLFCGLCLAVPLVGSYVIEQVVVPRLAARYGVELRLTEAKVRLRRVHLRGLIVRIPGRTDPLTAPRAEVRFALLPLLRGQVELTEVVLDRPLIQIVRGGDEDNISGLIQRLRSGSAATAGGEPTRSSRLRGPQLLTTRSAEVDIRDDAGVIHVGGLEASVERSGSGTVTLSDTVAEMAGGASARAERVVVRWQGGSRFLPIGLPEIEVVGGQVVPWRRLAMTGISGTIRPDSAEPSRAVISLTGGYGGVDRQLWQARGWVRPDGSGGLLHQRSAEAELNIYAQRFLLSSLEPILKDTPIVDADQTQVDASLELRFAQRVLDFNGSFHMLGLSVFTPRLVAEPIRDLRFDASARGRVDLKTRRFKLEKAEVRWNGATAALEGEAEAQPASARRAVAATSPSGATGSQSPSQPAAPSWRERWRTVWFHLTVPPIGCQELLNSMPTPIVPRIREFRLAGSFSTDVKVWVDFAKLMKLPPPTDPNNPEDEDGSELAVAPPAAGPAPTPPASVATAAKSKTPRPAAGPATASAKDPKDDPVQLSGRVGIDGCKVLEAPKDMDAARLLEPFLHSVPIEGDRELRFLIGPENPDFVPYEELSPYLINSIMTTEDNGFLRHRGFILPEFRSALQANLERGYFRLGASSITMQMVKNVLLSREKTLSRKLQELFITWYLEGNLTDDAELLKAIGKGSSPNQFWLNKLLKTPASALPLPRPLTPTAAGTASIVTTPPLSAQPLALTPAVALALPIAPPAVDPATAPVTAAQAYSPLRDINPIKRRILEIYFNAIEFGPYLYGIGKATRHYFGKPPKDLTPREAVWFSSILPNPKRRYIHYCKGAPDDKWEKYLDRILRRVHERGRITDAEYATALQQRLVFDRTEALPEKDCLALILRLTEPPPGTVASSPGAIPPAPIGNPLQPPKLPPPPPWAEAEVHTVAAARHH